MLHLIRTAVRFAPAAAVPLLLLILLAAGCNKNTGLECRFSTSALAEVERNCTGTYVLIGDKCHKVCNSEALRDYSDGDRLDIHYRALAGCTEEDRVICMMAFPNDGWVEISCMNKRAE